MEMHLQFIATYIKSIEMETETDLIASKENSIGGYALTFQNLQLYE